MDNNLNRKINNYGMDVTEELTVSPFEYIDTFHIRSNLLKNYNKLTSEQKDQIRQYDLILLKRAKEFYDYVSEIHDWNRTLESINEWWWHLDKIIEGKLKVDIENNTVEYKG